VTVCYIANSRTLEASSTLAAQLQGALDSRVVIEQAKGRLAERLGITVSEAFDLMRRHARGNQLAPAFAEH
jgi:AmiR/NasT family two-component response regulator